MNASDASDLAAILLAGGRGSRMGGENKPLLEVGGRTLLDAAVSAARAVGADPIIAVGPAADVGADVSWVREDPPFGGPAAAIIAALPFVPAARTLVLACDLPRVADAVQLLRAPPADADADGACLTDESGAPQWLTGMYRTDSLRDAAAALADAGRNASVRALLGDLWITRVSASDDLAADVDTWDDLTEARRRHP